MIKYRFLNTNDEKLREQVEGLIQVLSPRSPARTLLPSTWSALLCDTYTNMVVAYEEDGSRELLLGMGTLHFKQKLVHAVAEIDDVVVDTPYLRRGIGREMIELLIVRAKQLSRNLEVPITISLTSRPSRVSANVMYVKLGFSCVAVAIGGEGRNLYRMTVLLHE